MSRVEGGCEVPVSSYGIAEAGGFVWTAVKDRGEVWRLDPTRCDGEHVTLGDDAQPRVIVAGGDPLALWVGDAVAPYVYRIDPTDLGSPESFQVSGAPAGIAVGGDAVWITVRGSDEVVRLDASTGQSTARIPVGDRGCNAPAAIAIGADGVWVACQESGRLVRIDPANARIVGRLPVDGIPFAVEADDSGDVWVTVDSDEGA
jgi:streptogramin lyase